MDALLAKLREDYPRVTFTEGTVFCWSPITGQIFYASDRKDTRSAQYSILHELAHALLSHEHYGVDYELLYMEIAAWEHAKEIAAKYGIAIDEEYIQHCLDSYRDWLYKRSICPGCSTKSLQQDLGESYICFNCHTEWHVASSKFCRPYRQQRDNVKESPAMLFAGDSFSDSAT